MKLFGLNIELSRDRRAAAAPARLRSLTTTPVEWLRGEEGSGQALSSAYEQVVWVYRAVNALAEQVANIPFLFSVGERGRENLVTSGPLLDFYARPHPQLNRFQYWELRVIWLMLRGECMRIPIYEEGAGAGRRLKSVLVADPTRFQHIVEEGQLIGWRYVGGGPSAPLASQVFLPEEVWFDRLPNPFDFWRGLPPLRVAATAAGADFAAASFMRGLIENNADNGMIVRTDKLLDDEQKEQIVAALRARKRRAGMADRPVFLCGVTEIVRPELSSSDLQFLENRKFTRSEICAAFGVPEEIVTSTDHNKYDVMEGARLNFIENRVAPLCSRLEAAEEATVRAVDPSASGWFDLDSLPILQQARRVRLQAARSGFEMGVPFNELNRVLDLGFKPLPWGDTGYVAGSLNAVKGGNETPPAVVESATNDSAADDLPAGRLRRFFFEQRCRALLALGEGAPGGEPGENTGVPGEEVAERLLDLEQEDRHLLAAMGPLLGEAGDAASAGLIRRDHSGLESRLQNLNRMTFSALRQQVAQGRAAGESGSQVRARIRALYNELAHRRTTQFLKAIGL